MKVVVGSDHAGFLLKEAVAVFLQEMGNEVLDVGTNGTAPPVDYPDYAEAVADLIIAGKADRGILICGSGIGASVAANKIAGIIAGLCHDSYSARQGVEHDCMNVLVLGARVIGTELALDLVRIFMKANFSGEERHQRRLNKIRRIEARGIGASKV